MATSMEVRLAPVTARDGVDTRKKDNSVMPAGGSGETTRLGAGDHVRDAQTAAIAYLVPPGAEVEGSVMNTYWTNYLRTAENYIKGDPLEFFKFTSFKHQQGFNEADIKRECYKLGAGEEMLTIYRQFYNSYVTEYLAEPNPRRLKYALEFLADYNKELAEQNNAAKLIQQAYRSFKVQVSDTSVFIVEEEYGKCLKCDEPSMGVFVKLCADCYWTEDSDIKRKRREARDIFFGLSTRGNTSQSNDSTVGIVLIPEPAIDIMDLINRATDMTGNAEWDAFWSKHYTSNLKIRIPAAKPCKCGYESTTSLNGQPMCEPCAEQEDDY